MRGQDAGRPGWSDHAADDVKGDLLVDDDSIGMEEVHVRVRPPTSSVIVDDTRMPVAA